MRGCVACAVLALATVTFAGREIVNEAVDKILEQHNSEETRRGHGLMSLPPFNWSDTEWAEGYLMGLNSYRRRGDAVVRRTEGLVEVELEMGLDLLGLAVGRLGAAGRQLSALLLVGDSALSCGYSIRGLGTPDCELSLHRLSVDRLADLRLHTSLPLHLDLTRLADQLRERLNTALESIRPEAQLYMELNVCLSPTQDFSHLSVILSLFSGLKQTVN